MNKNIIKVAPLLRFPIFSDDWDRKKVGHELEQYTEKVPADTDLPVYSSSRIGLYAQKDYFANREVTNEGEYGVVPFGYFVYRHMSDDFTFKFNFNDFVEKLVVSKEYPVFKTNSWNPYFFLYKLNNSSDFKRFAATQKLGGTRTRLYFKKLCEWKTLIPSIDEQLKIANFLSSVDKKFLQLTEKQSLLQQYKKGIMQKMFSQKIRFKDGQGDDFPDWEEKKLGEIAVFFKGNGISKSDIVDDGKTACIRYGELYTKYTEVIESVISKTNIPVKNLTLSEYDDVIIPSSGETQIDIATTSCVRVKGGAYSGDLTIIRSDIDGIYLSYYLNSHKKIDIAKLSQGNSVIHLYARHLKLLKIDIPVIEEQNKIASFLGALDKKIDFTKQQIEQTKIFKKGLLQQMFVAL